MLSIMPSGPPGPSRLSEAVRPAGAQARQASSSSVDPHLAHSNTRLGSKDERSRERTKPDRVPHVTTGATASVRAGWQGTR